MRNDFMEDTENIAEEQRAESQPSELTEKANVVEQFVEQGLQERQKYERQWFINMAYYCGKQWVSWNTITRQLQLLYDPAHRKRVTVNKIMPAVLKEVGRMTNSKPKFFVVPDEPTEEAKEIARMSEDLLDFWNRELGIPLINHDLLIYMLVYGTGFKDVFWNPFAGELVADPMTGEEVMIGEVEQEVLSPFHVIKESGVCDIDNGNKIVIIKARSLQWVKEHYPEWGYLVKAETERSLSSTETQLNSLLSDNNNQSAPVSLDKDSGYVNVKEYRELPCEKYPQGRVIVVANKIFLSESTFPLQWQIKDRSLGVLQYDFIKIPGRPYGRSYIEDLIPQQTEYNKTLSQIYEHRNICKAKFLKAKGHNLRVNPNSEVGEVIEYTPVAGASEPHWTAPEPLPAYLEKLLERQNRDIQDITSQHEVSKGQTPPGVTANVAIETLTELDSTQYSSTHDRYSHLEANAGMMMLKIAKEKYNEPRKIEIVSAEDELQVKYFDRARELPTKIIVQRGSSLGELKSVKTERILQLADRGILDKNDRKDIFKLMEFGGLEEKIKIEQADEQRALLENSRIIEETPLMVEHFDNHQVHIMVHNDKFRKTVEYEKLSPEQKQKIDQHVMIHGGVLAGALQQDPITKQWVPRPQPVMPAMPQEQPGGNNAVPI